MPHPDALAAARIPYELGGLVNELDTQARLTGAGLGLSIVPRLGRGALPDDVVAVPIDGPTPVRRLLRVERKDAVDRPALEVVRRAVDQQAEAVLRAPSPGR